jgi:bacterioferritin
MLKKAMQMEEGSVVDYNNAAIECSKLADSASKQLFETLVADEERHFAAFEDQADNIERFGQSYLALQSFQQGGEEPGPDA